MTINPRKLENLLDLEESCQADSAYQRPLAIAECVYHGNPTCPTWCAKREWYVDLSMCPKCEYYKERK